MGKGKKGLLAVAFSCAAAAVAYKIIKNKKNAQVAATFVSSFDENGNETFTKQSEIDEAQTTEVTAEAEETAMPEEIFKEENSDISETETD